jgi:histidinol-phosphate aminotransferase
VHDLRHHGDAEATPGLLDLAVNVRGTAPPAWLTGRLERGLRTLGAYPDQRAAVAAVCHRHERPEDEVLLTAGAAEAFVLLARVLRPRHAVCVHPGFTEPEAALRAAGHDVDRLVLAPPYVLDPAQVPDDADLVVVGNPTNPTGVVHERLAELCRPGRTVVVDEAFADAVPGEPQSFAARSDLPGLVVVRSLTKTWALAGLRVGYLLAPAELVARLRDAQPLWAVSSLGLIALDTCLARGPVTAARRDAEGIAAERAVLEQALTDAGVEVSPGSQAPYLLCRVPGRPDVRDALRAQGVAVRRGDTFPGLTAEHWRTAVRGPVEREALLEALRRVGVPGGSGVVGGRGEELP